MQYAPHTYVLEYFHLCHYVDTMDEPGDIMLSETSQAQNDNTA
jgi:hypothetical protein